MYFLFAGQTYYPRGGVGDLVGSFSTHEAVTEAATALAGAVDEDGYTINYDWYQIATIVDGKLQVTL
jgi:hypothetical protein